MSEDNNLQSFIGAVNQLYQHVPGRAETGFDIDFQELKRLSASLKQNSGYETLHGSKPENKKKNRYKDILPFDYSRVKLDIADDDQNSDYINASFVKGAYGHRNYIASQGPLPHTVGDFWKMLWKYNVAVIVMVCREIEMGKKKCERYWSEKGETKTFGDIHVTLKEEQNFKDGYCLRIITAQRGNESRTIKQFHYISWPDHGVPKTCYEILTLINHVRDKQSYQQDETTPLCVHCSAGCGRTGAVLAVDYVRNFLEEKKVPANLKTFDIIAEMRKQRPAIVQTRDQYEFVNAAISEMFQIYMQTRSVSYSEFTNGYEQGAYVNINLTTTTYNGALEPKKDAKPSSRPETLRYENIEVVRMHANTHTLPHKSNVSRSDSTEYPSDPPPAKPSRNITKNTSRPVSAYVVSTSPANPLHGLWGSSGPNKNSPTDVDRKASLPQLYSTTLPKPNISNNRKTPNQAFRLPSPTNPVGPKEPNKPPPPLAKPKPKFDQLNKNSSDVSSPTKPSGKDIKANPIHASTNVSSSSVMPLSLSSFSPSTHKISSPFQPQAKPRTLTPKTKRKNQTPESSEVKSPISQRMNFFESKIEKRDDEEVNKIMKRKLVQKTSNENKILIPSTQKTEVKSSKAKLLQQELNSLDVHKKDDEVKKTRPEPVLRIPKPNIKLRPYSQNITLTQNPEVKPGLSVSVFDLNKVKKDLTPDTSQKKNLVQRSVSVGGTDSQENGSSSFQNIRSKFQTENTSNNNNSKMENSDVKVSQVSIPPPEDDKPSYSNNSYGVAFVATRAPTRSNSQRASKKELNYSISSPVPFKLKSKLSLLKKASADNQDEKVTKKPHHTSTPSFTQSEKSTQETTSVVRNYVNTEFLPAGKNQMFKAPVIKLSTSSVVVDRSLSTSSEDSDVFTTSLTPKTSGDGSHRDLESPVTFCESQPLHDTSTAPSHGLVEKTLEKGEGVAQKPPVAPKSAVPPLLPDSKPKKAPMKPRRTMKGKSNGQFTPKLKIVNDDHPTEPGNKSPTTNNFTTYKKKHLYSDVDMDADKPSLVPEAEYEFGEEAVIPRCNSASSLGKPQIPLGKPSPPPKLPARTAESQMILGHSPPALPARTPESYLPIEEDEDDDQQTYESVDQTPCTIDARSPRMDTGRRSSSNPPITTNSLAAKAKGVFEKTTSAFSKVGASLAKTMDEDSSAPKPSTLEGRTPTYVPGPTVYGGQDMSFGKRLMRKVKGGRGYNPNK